MKVIAYYTRGTDYADEADLLRASLDRHGIDHHIVGVPDRGSWDANTARKANFCRAQRRLQKGSLLYIDVDAVVNAPLGGYFAKLTASGYDFGAHWFRGPAFGHDRSKVRDEGWWMLSGTLFLGDTQGCRRLLEYWCTLNATKQKAGVMAGGGQKNLQEAVADMQDQLKIARIPGRFCYCYDKPWAYPPDEPRIIEHTIASREHRDPRRSIRSLVQSRRAKVAELRDQYGL